MAGSGCIIEGNSIGANSIAPFKCSHLSELFPGPPSHQYTFVGSPKSRSQTRMPRLKSGQDEHSRENSKRVEYRPIYNMK